MTLDDQARLKTALWVQAQLRLCDLAAIPFIVARRGDADAGAVLIKLDRGGGRFSVLARGYRADGRRGWLSATGPAPVSEADSDAYLLRQVAIDPDVWILSVEDSGGRFCPDGETV